MLDKALVEQKLAYLIEHLDELEKLSVATLEEYKSDAIKRHATEKLIELVVGYATDINQLVVEEVGRSVPQTYYDTFMAMQDLGILSQDLAARLANTTGLRNRLVHQYERLNYEAVYYSLKPLAKNYRQYIVLLNDYLRSAS